MAEHAKNWVYLIGDRSELSLGSWIENSALPCLVLYVYMFLYIYVCSPVKSMSNECKELIGEQRCYNGNK